MKTIKAIAVGLLLLCSADIGQAQMIRNKAIHFNRHRVVHHHHKK